jgi:hypothetical protein
MIIGMVKLLMKICDDSESTDDEVEEINRFESRKFK